MKESSETVAQKNPKLNTFYQRFKTPLERFWEKVNKSGPIPTHVPEIGNCWEWTGGSDADGYGRLHLNRKPIIATRYSWIVHFGEITNNLLVLHKCDNPPCVNPSHLFLGTNTDNQRDASKKGRFHPLKGSQVKTSKLSEDDIIFIRKNAIFGQYSKIAKKFGITNQTICKIMLRQCWAHI